MGAMNVLHVALRASSEENAARFYGDLLGLGMVKSYDVGPALMDALFGLDRSVKVIVYGGGAVSFELFLLPGAPPPAPDHTCIGTSDLPGFLAACRDAGVEVVSAPKGDRTITFVHDFDGNRFEVKET
jgi:catechol 2,3-dioxygenase-like lactoylglutathione lyase family enzyme